MAARPQAAKPKPARKIRGRLASVPIGEPIPPHSAPTSTQTAEIIALHAAQKASPSSSSSRLTGVASTASHVFCMLKRANEPIVVSKLAANIAE